MSYDNVTWQLHSYELNYTNRILKIELFQNNHWNNSSIDNSLIQLISKTTTQKIKKKKIHTIIVLFLVSVCMVIKDKKKSILLWKTSQF